MDTRRHQLVVLAAGTRPMESTLTVEHTESPMIRGRPVKSLFTYDFDSNELTFLRVVSDALPGTNARYYRWVQRCLFSCGVAFDPGRDEIHVLDGDRIRILDGRGGLRTEVDFPPFLCEDHPDDPDSIGLPRSQPLTVLQF